MYEGGRTGRVEGWTQGEQLVERQAEVADVTPRVDLPHDLFRGHVAKRPYHPLGIGEVVVFHQARQAEVSDPHRSLAVQQ